MTELASCPVCTADASTHSEFMRRDAWRLRSCSTCTAVYLTTPPTDADLADAHRWSSSYHVERESRARRDPIAAYYGRVAQPLMRRIRRDKLGTLVRRHVGAGNLLDVGCGSGNLLARMPRSITPFGIEVDPVGAAAAKAAFEPRGGHVWTAPATAALPQIPRHSMDGALLFSYLEHETRPHEVLELLGTALKPGAPVIIKVPNHASLNRLVRGSRWCGYRFPDHVVYYTPTTLARLLNDHGYTIIRSKWNDRFPTSDSMWVVAARVAKSQQRSLAPSDPESRPTVRARRARPAAATIAARG